MKTLIQTLFLLFLNTQIMHAGNPKCDSLMKVMSGLRNQSNAYSNKYKVKIDAHGAEMDRIVRGSSGDTTSARNLVARYEDDLIYFQSCLDTALLIQKEMRETELVFTKACDNVVSSKTFYQIQDQNANALIFLEGFIDFAEDMKKEWVKKLKHTKKEYAELIEFFRKN